MRLTLIAMWIPVEQDDMVILQKKKDKGNNNELIGKPSS